MDCRFSAGVARADITPPVGIAHGNWGAQQHERAAGVDLPLWATALAMSDGETTTLTVDLDLLYLWPEDAQRVREEVADLTGVSPSQIRISYTHTHSGPTPRRETWVEEGAEMLGPYLDALPQRIAGAAWEAVQSLRPARLAAGSGTSRIAVNRRFERPEDDDVIVGRNPDGPVDHEVLVVRIDDLDGAPIAAIANYACHPITVGPDNELITPDYPGVVKRTVEEATSATCLFLQGATGDVGPVRGVAEGGIDEYRPLGRRLGHEVSRVWWALDPTERQERYVETVPSGAPLARYEATIPAPRDRPVVTATRDIELELRDLPTPEDAEAGYERHFEWLQRLRENDASKDEIQEATQQSRQAEIRLGTARQYAGQTHQIFELQVFAVGRDLALAAIPGEPFVEIQREVKARSPFDRTLFSGYSNVGLAYIPTEDAYPEGGYEVEVTPFALGAAEQIVDVTVDELSQVYDRVG